MSRTQIGQRSEPGAVDPSIEYADLPAWMRADHIYKVDVLGPTLNTAHDFVRLVDVLKGLGGSWLSKAPADAEARITEVIGPRRVVRLEC